MHLLSSNLSCSPSPLALRPLFTLYILILEKTWHDTQLTQFQNTPDSCHTLLPISQALTSYRAMSPDCWAPITFIGDDKLELLKNYTICFELQFVAASPVIPGGHQDGDLHDSTCFLPQRKHFSSYFYSFQEWVWHWKNKLTTFSILHTPQINS